jgi:ATP-dependent HslUV protease ATP-binding subunit HslU
MLRSIAVARQCARTRRRVARVRQPNTGSKLCIPRLIKVTSSPAMTTTSHLNTLYTTSSTRSYLTTSHTYTHQPCALSASAFTRLQQSRRLLSTEKKTGSDDDNGDDNGADDKNTATLGGIPVMVEHDEDAEFEKHLVKAAKRVGLDLEAEAEEEHLVDHEEHSTSRTPIDESSSENDSKSETVVQGKTEQANAEADAEAEAEAEAEEEVEDVHDLKPREFVHELDRYIVGQQAAKRSVAIAMRNRWRRHRLQDVLKDEVMPKNILMIGPTGVGKTEIARRLAKITNAPFVKVEATKFTEIGFHGRDVDSIIRDLVEVAISNTKTLRRKRIQPKIDKYVEDAILKQLLGPSADAGTVRTFRDQLRKGMLERNMIDVEVANKDFDAGNGAIPNEVLFNLKKIMGRKAEKRRMTIAEARPLIAEMETERLVGTEDIVREALKSAEQDGIVFIDEIDKICSRSQDRHGADASSEGVQRDLLPLIEGCTISTKHGNIDTDHILFVASGAFHQCKPSDMLAELQGRLPIRVELKGLSEDDMYRILTEPESNLIKQQQALLKTEDVDLVFTDEAIRTIAKMAAEINRTVENIGARRLHTVIERIVEEVSFDAPDMAGKTITITPEVVSEKVDDLLIKSDLSKFIL